MKGGKNTKLHAVTDAIGRPITFFMSAGQVRWSGCHLPQMASQCAKVLVFNAIQRNRSVVTAVIVP